LSLIDGIHASNRPIKSLNRHINALNRHLNGRNREPNGAAERIGHKQDFAMTRYLTLAAFILLTVGGGTLLGVYNLPGEWYANLQKPVFNPPNWIFGPVWTVLYIMIGIAGWRTWGRRAEGVAMQVWFGQLAANFAWSPVFFSMRSIGLALVIILVMLALIVTFVALTWNRDRTAALLFLPYTAWVSFATVLNAAILFLNG
jgi:tryptophan-rich sensory protein